MKEIYYYKKEGSNGGPKEQMNFVALQQDNTTFSQIATVENILYNEDGTEGGVMEQNQFIKNFNRQSTSTLPSFTTTRLKTIYTPNGILTCISSLRDGTFYIGQKLILNPLYKSDKYEYLDIVVVIEFLSEGLRKLTIIEKNIYLNKI
jgi:hypothetical protein